MIPKVTTPAIPIGRGEAGELGRRRKGTAKFLKNGQSPTTFFAFAFLDFESSNTGNVQPSYSSAEEPCAERVKKKCVFRVLL